MLIVGSVTLFGLLIFDLTSHTNLVMFYLLGVVVAAIRYGRAAAMLTAIFSVAAFNIGFVHPRFTIHVADAQNLLTFAILGGVGIIIADISARMRDHAQAAQQRERYTSALYSLSSDLSATIELDDILRITLEHVSQTFKCECLIMLKDEIGLNTRRASPRFKLSSGEKQTANEVYESGEFAAELTDTYTRYLPLKTAQHTLGVLVVRLPDALHLTPERLHLLDAFASHAALGIDAVFLSQEAQQAQLLKETERLQSALLNSISHDLRTPLVSITGTLSSLIEQAEYLDETARRELIQGAWEEAKRLNRLVGNLLEMTRLEAGAVKLKPMPAELGDLIGVALSQNPLSNRTINIELPADLPLVDVDFVLVVLVLSNLLENASKYSPEGSPIQISARQADSMIRVSISDQGIGIQADDLPLIFDKFYRAESAGGMGGSGLGLSICKGIVEAHGGTIWVESKNQVGSTFHFTLPIVS